MDEGRRGARGGQSGSAPNAQGFNQDDLWSLRFQNRIFAYMEEQTVLLQRIATAIESPGGLGKDVQRQRAIGLLKSLGPNIALIARTIGVPENTLRGWSDFMEQRNNLRGLLRGIDKGRTQQQHADNPDEVGDE